MPVCADQLSTLPARSVVAVAMSGGVDSSVAAALCTDAGATVIGFTLVMWEGDREDIRDRGCCSIDAVSDARRIARLLGIRHYTWNLREEFEAEVVRRFEDDYASGRTPNPCVRCNERIKFGALADRARQLGATHLATGHHARRGWRDGIPTLHRSLDPSKDQSYTLHRLTQDQVGTALFPLGRFASKAEVRADAARRGFPVAAKPDSQELCFVEGSMAADLARRLAGRFSPGPLRDGSGRVVGEHRGVPFYTVGQRAGLGLAPDRPDAEPRYVTSIDAQSNTITVGRARDLMVDTLGACEASWMDIPPAVGEVVDVQVRAHGRGHRATVAGCEGDRLALAITSPIPRVAPGQAVVVYRGDQVIGGATVVGGT